MARLMGSVARTCHKCGQGEGVTDWFVTEVIEGVDGFERRIRSYACIDCFGTMPAWERRAYLLRETV